MLASQPILGIGIKIGTGTDQSCCAGGLGAGLAQDQRRVECASVELCGKSGRIRTLQMQALGARKGDTGMSAQAGVVSVSRRLPHPVGVIDHRRIRV